MRIELSATDYEFFTSNFDCAIDSIRDVKKSHNSVSFVVNNSDLTTFEVDMTSDIIHNGMDNQNTVNDTGKRMYEIYDNIIDQK